MSLAEDQVFEHKSLEETFHIQSMAAVHPCIVRGMHSIALTDENANNMFTLKLRLRYSRR